MILWLFEFSCVCSACRRLSLSAGDSRPNQVGSLLRVYTITNPSLLALLPPPLCASSPVCPSLRRPETHKELTVRRGSREEGIFLMRDDSAETDRWQMKRRGCDGGIPSLFSSAYRNKSPQGDEDESLPDFHTETGKQMRTKIFVISI